MKENAINIELTNPACGLIADELEAREITQTEASKAMGINKQLLNAIVNYRREVSTEMAMRVERYLGINAEWLLSMQTVYKLKKAKAEKAEIINSQVESLIARY